MTDPTPSETDRQRIGRELSDIASRLGASDRDLARRFGVDRGTIVKVFDGDESVRPRKWAEVESKIRALDEEMDTERDEEPAEEDIVEIRASGNFGVDIVVRGPVSDLAQLEDAVVRLVKRMSGGANGTDQ